MTNQSFTHKLTRPLVITLLAAVAVPALISAPSAYGGERVKARNSNNTYQSDRASTLMGAVCDVAKYPGPIPLI